MSSTLGSANIGGNTYLGVWSGKPYQDPIGANTLPNQGAGGIKSQNSLNGHIGANWPQGPVLPPANQWIQSDHGPSISNTGDTIYWQTASGTWADVENAGTPLVGLFQGTSSLSMRFLASPAFSREWNIGDAVDFTTAVNGSPAAQAWLEGLAGAVITGFSDDRLWVEVSPVDMTGAPPLTGASSIVAVTPVP